MCAALTAADQGASVMLMDRGKGLGGQLVKQTHQFFGSEQEYAGIRGIHIANILEEVVRGHKNIEIKTDTTVLAIYEDGVITMEEAEKYKKLTSKKTIIAAGAAEKMLAFPNNDLPGVYGAGAVQTLMNEHGVIPGNNALMIGSGNIGLIVSYQLMQAGVKVAMIIEAAPLVGGYDVHAARVKRMGVPILTTHTIKEAVGRDCVEGAIICQLDDNWNQIAGTEKNLEVDVICLSVGLSPLVELLRLAGCQLKYVKQLGGYVPVRDENLETTVQGIYVAGDTAAVEEASSAMIEGRIAGFSAAKALGYNQNADQMRTEQLERLRILRAGGVGRKIGEGLEVLGVNGVKETPQEKAVASPELAELPLPPLERRRKGPFPLFECFQEIPCNPCFTACEQGVIEPFDDINHLPEVNFEKDCTGCAMCVAACPGLACFIIDETYSDTEATITLAYEFLPLPRAHQEVEALDHNGNIVGKARVVKVRKKSKKDLTAIITISVNKEKINIVRNIRLRG